MNSHIKDLEERINQMSDDELVEMIAIKYSDYTDEALSIAKKVAEKRGLANSIKDKEEIIRKNELKKEEEIVRKYELEKETEDKKNLFIFVPTTGRIIFCVLFTLILISRVQNYQDDFQRFLGSLIAIILLVLLVWASAYRLFPWSAKGLIVKPNRIVFGIKEGKKTDILENIERVTLSQSGNVMTVVGLNKNGERATRNIKGKYLKKADYEIIKIILKDKIES